MRIEGQVPIDKVYNSGSIQGQAASPVERPDMERLNTGEEELNKDKAENIDKLDKTVKHVNQVLNISNYHLEFQLHERSGRYAVKVVDSDTKEVIREVPPERILEISARIREMLDDALGIIVDETV